MKIISGLLLAVCLVLTYVVYEQEKQIKSLSAKENTGSLELVNPVSSNEVNESGGSLSKCQTRVTGLESLLRKKNKLLKLKSDQLVEFKMACKK